MRKPKSKTRHISVSLARAFLSRLSARKPRQSNQQHHKNVTPPSTPPTPQDCTQTITKPQDRPAPQILRASKRCIPKTRPARARSDMHIDNEAMQKRLSELEMIEMENSSLRLQLDDLQRALDGIVENQREEHVGELEMAYIENSALRLHVECLRDELAKPFYGTAHVVDTRLAWLNVDPV